MVVNLLNIIAYSKKEEEEEEETLGRLYLSQSVNLVINVTGAAWQSAYSTDL